MSHALILLAHGSRDPRWKAPFESLAETLAGRLSTPLRMAYMELCEPSLEATVAELRDSGIERADILPLFFAAGRHLREDVPGQITALGAAAAGGRASGLRRRPGRHHRRACQRLIPGGNGTPLAPHFVQHHCLV